MKLRDLELLLLPAALTLCGAAAAAVTASAGPGEEDNTAAGTQITQIEGFDWGPGVTKTILTLDHTITAESVSVEKFSVVTKKEDCNYADCPKVSGGPAVHLGKESRRTVADAYTCDEKGNRVAGSSSHIALELTCTPSEGSPFCYDVLTGQNHWSAFYSIDVTLCGGAVLTGADGKPITALAVEPAVDWNQALIPQLAEVDLTGRFTSREGDEMTYGSYVPANADADHKRPLVIWLHGAGEGGTDNRIVWLGNKVTALLSTEFQNTMGGAYILTPQVPDFWMTYNKAGDWQDNPGTDSVHLHGLKELIDMYVAANPGVNRDRILIGGCSNGGYMTMDLIMNHPDYFAAAYPICEAYRDDGIADEQLQRIKHLPVWFVYAQNDTTVDPVLHAVPTIERLKAMGGDVHASVFPDVHDTAGLYKNEDGTPYQYIGHWSWLYFFNNKCSHHGFSIWKWMGRQSR